MLLDDLCLEVMAVVVPARPVAGAADGFSDLALLDDVAETVVSHDAAVLAAREEPVALAVAAARVVRLGELEVSACEKFVELFVREFHRFPPNDDAGLALPRLWRDHYGVALGSLAPQ